MAQTRPLFSFLHLQTPLSETASRQRGLATGTADTTGHRSIVYCWLRSCALWPLERLHFVMGKLLLSRFFAVALLCITYMTWGEESRIVATWSWFPVLLGDRCSWSRDSWTMFLQRMNIGLESTEGTQVSLNWSAALLSVLYNNLWWLPDRPCRHFRVSSTFLYRVLPFPIYVLPKQKSSFHAAPATGISIEDRSCNCLSVHCTLSRIHMPQFSMPSTDSGPHWAVLTDKRLQDNVCNSGSTCSKHIDFETDKDDCPDEHKCVACDYESCVICTALLTLLLQKARSVYTISNAHSVYRCRSGGFNVDKRAQRHTSILLSGDTTVWL